MNGIHDLGGMHGFGPVLREENEPVFHERWEGRVYAINVTTRLPGGLRPIIEQMSPPEYLSASYYERWLHAKIVGLADARMISSAELDERVERLRNEPHAEVPRKYDPAAVAERVEALFTTRSPEREPQGDPGFSVGDAVRARNLNPAGHTRLPRYIRGHLGTVQRFYGWHELHDFGESGEGREKIEPIYSVRYEGTELWGDAAEPNQSVYIDMWESYLEPVQ